MSFSRPSFTILQPVQAAGLKYPEQGFDHVRILATKSEAELAAIPKRVAEALDKVSSGKPLFLYFGFSQPHRRYPDEFDRTRFDPAKLTLPPDWPDLPEVRVDYARYLTAIFALDRGFGLLMQTLKRRGLFENTMVIFMGDNGEALLRGKGTLYDRGTHVPLVVRWPGVVAPGMKSETLVSGEDIAATVLEGVGLPVPAEMTGVSFLPALKGQPFAGRGYVFAERGWHYGPVTRTDGLDLSRAIASKRHRLIYNVLPDRVYTPVDMPDTEAWRAIVRARQEGRLTPLHQRLLFAQPRPVFEFYDHDADPFELNNLAGQPPVEAIESAMRNELARWMVREGDFLPLPSASPPKE